MQAPDAGGRFVPKTRTVRKWLYFAMLGILVTSLLTWYLAHDRLPKEIRIATAAPGGLYHRVGTLLAATLSKKTGHPVRVVESKGSMENRDLLMRGEVDLAILQASAAPMDGLASLAPLYKEVCHIIVRRSAKITAVRELEGHSVVLGPVGSGMRESALRILEHYRLETSKLKDTEHYFQDLLTDKKLDAAIVTTGMVNPDMISLMASGEFDLLPLRDAEALSVRYGYFIPIDIPRSIYNEGPPIPTESVPAVATTAFLAARQDASSLLVGETLDALYQSDMRSELSILIPTTQARDYPLARLHPTALTYHDPYGGLGVLSNVMQFLVAFKELVIAIGAGIYILWDRWNRIRERESKEEVRAQKEHLDKFLNETVRIEKEQMTVEDPKRLRAYLDEVTRIKLRALEELTHEDLRGDRLFSIFLMQCSNLIRKIQSKIILSAQLSTNQAIREAGKDEMDEVME
jgi:TRAP transporter TAXI family solute receptor